MAWCDEGHKYNERVHASCPICAKDSGGSPAARQMPKTVCEIDEIEDPPAPGPTPIRPISAEPVVSVKKGGPRTRLETEDAEERLMGFLVTIQAKNDPEHAYARLTQGVNWIGRDEPDCHIRLRDPGVSRRHAIVVCTDAAVRLLDLDSSRGTKVNSKAIDLVDLVEGDVITVGKTSLLFVPFPWIADD